MVMMYSWLSLMMMMMMMISSTVICDLLWSTRSLTAGFSSFRLPEVAVSSSPIGGATGSSSSLRGGATSSSTSPPAGGAVGSSSAGGAAGLSCSSVASVDSALTWFFYKEMAINPKSDWLLILNSICLSLTLSYINTYTFRENVYEVKIV